MIHTPRPPSLLVVSTLAALGLIALAAATGRSQVRGEEPALPDDRVVIDIDAPERKVFRIGIENISGQPASVATLGADVLRNDFRIMPGYQVVGSEEIDSAIAGREFQPGPWTMLGANGVTRGQVLRHGSGIEARFQFYPLPGSNKPALTRAYRGDPKQMRVWTHDFANHVLRVITGKLGPFGTKIAFGRRHGPGRKDVYAAGMDGHGLARVSSGKGVSMLPALSKGIVWFTRMTTNGTLITNSKARGRRIIGGQGLHMAPAVCDGRVYFTSSRDGNSEIYSANLKGTDVRRLTRHRGIDVSPACGPGGKLAFVSNRHGSPQVFTMNRNGSNVRRVTFKGSYNQTPSWCRDSKTPIIAFSGRDRGGLDIFTVNLKTQQYTRVTQGTGENKDPAFSRDCRVVAFASTRRGAPGVYLASPEGFDQVRVIEGAAETVRW